MTLTLNLTVTLTVTLPSRFVEKPRVSQHIEKEATWSCGLQGVGGQATAAPHRYEGQGSSRFGVVAVARRAAEAHKAMVAGPSLLGKTEIAGWPDVIAPAHQEAWKWTRGHFARAIPGVHPAPCEGVCGLRGSGGLGAS